MRARKGDTDTMQWELVGNQELWDSGVVGKGYAYRVLLWRTPVPGGWLLMTVNQKANSPDPTVSFYPDPEHRWVGKADPQSEILLRPASSGAITDDPQRLLRASSEED